MGVPDGTLALSAVKDSFGSDKVFVFNSILHQGPRGSNPKCPQAHSGARHGAEYAQLTSMTGGIEGSVCENSYAQQLSDIGQRTESLVRTVTLECAPQDINRDGVGDVAIFKNNQRIHPTFQLAGDKITFDVELGPGEYWFHYYCKK